MYLLRFRTFIKFRSSLLGYEFSRAITDLTERSILVDGRYARACFETENAIFEIHSLDHDREVR